MTERPFRDPKETLVSTVRKVRYESIVWLHQRNETRQQVAELINDVSTVLNKQLNPVHLPKILEMTVGQEEYVSLRRIELRTLKTTSPEGEDEELFDTRGQVRVPARFLPSDSHIGILVSPSIFGAEPTDREEIDFLNDKTEYDDDDGWSHGCKLQHFLAGGGKFDEKKWNFADSIKEIVVIVRRGDKFLTTGYLIPARHRKSGRPISGVEQVVLDKNGDLILPFHGYYWSKADVEAQEKVDEKYGMFYVVTSGSSEKETNLKLLKKLVPQETHSTI